MNGIAILLVSIAALLAGYVLYSRHLAKSWGIDPKAKTPAHTMQDGVDYVPTRPGVVFGHQFASIAGAGPINGRIQAAIFGWVPVLMWILLGGILAGTTANLGGDLLQCAFAVALFVPGILVSVQGISKLREGEGK